MAVRIEKRAVYICTDGKEFPDFASAQIHDHREYLYNRFSQMSIPADAINIILEHAYEIQVAIADCLKSEEAAR